MAIEPVDHQSSPVSPSPAGATPPRRSGLWRLIKWLVFLAVVVLGIGWIWHHFHAAPQAGGHGGGKGQGRRGGLAPGQVMPVQASKLVAGDLNIYVTALGSVVPLNAVTVNTRVGGQLMSVNFAEGQEVHQGDVLLQIDPRPYQVVLTQNQGQLTRDQALLATARLDLGRYQQLIKSASISQQQLDDQISLVHQYEGTVKSDQGLVDSAKLNLEYCRVLAPVSGRLGLRLVDPGNIVQANGTAIVTINQFKPIYVSYAIPEDQVQSVLKQVHGGQRLRVDAFDRAQQNLLATGELSSLDNSIDPTTGTLKMKAKFGNDSENLYPNQFVNVRMLVETQHNTTLLPSAAIQRGSKGTFVYVVNPDSTVTASPVKLGAVDGDNTGVISGVNAGDQVVFDGADKLKDGAKVRVIDPKARDIGNDAAMSGATAKGGWGGHHGGGHHHHGGDQSQAPAAS